MNNLVEIIRKLSYRTGNFVLSSGKTSHEFIDLKSTALHPEGAHLIGRLAWEALNDYDFQALAGPVVGACPILSAIQQRFWIDRHAIPVMYTRSEQKDHGLVNKIDGLSNVKAGAKVIVVEDVSTTGASALKCVKTLRDAGFNTMGVLTVVDREEGASEAFAAENLLFINLTTMSEIRTHFSRCLSGLE